MGFSLKRLFSVIALSLALLLSCKTGQDLTVFENSPIGETPAEAVSGTVESEDQFDYKTAGLYSRLTDGEKSALIMDIVNRMSTDEKIGQLFILAVRHTDYGKPALKVDETVASFVRKYRPGGIILFSLNFESPLQTIKLIRDLQETSAYPLFITTDEEGGKVSRLGKSEQMGVISLPPAEEMAAYSRAELIEQASEVLGMDMKELGFNMNMAPVADVVVPGKYNPIGNRSFGSDPELTGDLTAASVRGFQKAGIAPVLKHFPGHGNVGGDSHNGAVTSRSTREEFYTRDFIPFMKGIEAGCPFVMIGHISAPALTNRDEPASLSYEIQTRILRKELGFRGLIITDAMDMGAIKNIYSSGTAALKAFQAGTDIILMPENIPEAQFSLKKALESGELTQERLDESVIRILKVKIDNGLFDRNAASETGYDLKVRSERHQLLTNSLNSQ